MARIPPNVASKPNGGFLYDCDGPNCTEKRTIWTDDWLTYASLRDLEDDQYGFPTFCSTQCVQDFRAKQFSDGENPLPDPDKNENWVGR